MLIGGEIVVSGGIGHCRFPEGGTVEEVFLGGVRVEECKFGTGGMRKEGDGDGRENGLWSLFIFISLIFFFLSYGVWVLFF